MSKAVIAIDVDDVLAALVPSVAQFFNEAYPSLEIGKKLQLSDFFSYEWDKVLGISVEEVQVRMQHYFGSKYFEELPTIPGALEGLTHLHSKYSIHIVTSRQLFLETATRKWLTTHFPNLIDGVHFGNSYGVGPSRKKVDICKEINAIAIVDDIPSTCISCAEAGIQTVLFNLEGSYLWSALPTTSPVPQMLHTAKSWEEVVQILGK